MLTPCLGRDQVQATLSSALSDSRWVSLVGPPGSGKTLLARHVAASHPHAVWVDARGLRDCDEVLAACLEALGTELAPGDTPAGVLGRALDGQDVLLVVDGLDVVTTCAGPVLQALLEATADGRVVLTSLTMAGEPAERVVRVGPLPVPSPRSPLAGPAVDLFLDRVAAAGGHPVDLAASDADVRRLLTATGGLPLLIEQAAVQSALLGLPNATPAESLAEAVAAAYALLDVDQRRAFRRLGQLGFPVGIEVLAAVTGTDRPQAARLAGALARRSLVEVLRDGRFDMLSPIRAQAQALAHDDDAEATAHGLLEWADSVAPTGVNHGAADAPWLADFPAMRAAVLGACADPATRERAYSIANRIFSSLYTAMRARDAVEILEAVLTSGDGPAAIGAQVARRAGIAASEVRGTYEGLWLLDRADQHAAAAGSPDEQLAKNASIRAEMHLDAGDLHQAEAEALRAIALDHAGGSIVRQATRTLADLYVSSGRFAEAVRAIGETLTGTDTNDERWISLSGRTLLARVALEQGRIAEAVAAVRAVVAESRELAEDRVGLLAETLLRDLDRTWRPREVQRDHLPWAVRLPVMAQDARDLFAARDVRRAAGLAADVVALADSARLGRDAVEARLLLGRALLADGELEQAATTFVSAAEQAAAMPMPLRVADALDGLAAVAQHRGLRDARELAATAVALRAPRQAVAWGYAARYVIEPARAAPDGWVVDGRLTDAGCTGVAAVFSGAAPATPSPLDALTAAERQVADRVASGLTSRQIAQELFISPRTVDAHLTHIYRKLEINTRARLAAMVVDHR